MSFEDYFLNRDFEEIDNENRDLIALFGKKILLIFYENFFQPNIFIIFI